MRTRAEKGEPARGVVLAAFLGVCALADVSPLLKLRPPSVALDALLGGAERPGASAIFALIACAALAAPVIAAWWVARRLPLPNATRALFVSAAIVAVMFAVAWILGSRAASLQAIGRGSDQEACIVMPARALITGHWPYDRTLIWSGNPCSPGLGWILLATPFVLLSCYAGFLVAGAAAFLFLPPRLIDPRTTLVMLGLSLSCLTAWQSLATGADTLAIGIGLALVTALSAERRLTIVVAIAAGLLGSARLTLAFFPFVIAAALHAGGREAASRARVFAGVSIATLALAHGIPLAVDARSYLNDGPAHVLRIGEGLRREGWSSAIFVACSIAWIAYALAFLPRALPGKSGASRSLARQFDVATLTFLSVFAPALVDLLLRLRTGSEEDPATWRGGNWLLLALPSYAAAVAIAFRVDRSSADAAP